jgi:hypothetical protein
MTLKIGSLYCWISRHFYPIYYEDFRKPIDPSRPSQYNILNQNDIFLVIEYAKVKGRDCYQILHKDEVGWIVDPNPQSIKELSDDTNSR